MEKIVTKGIVLRATATKEADYILNILTDSLGRIAVVARGARRKGSRITASCELLAFSELTLYQRGGWYYLDEASTISLFAGLRQDIELLSLASYFAEMTEYVTAEEEPAPEVLSLLLNSLYALANLDRPQKLIKAAFELRDMETDAPTPDNVDELRERMDTYLGEFEQHGTDNITVEM